MKNFLLAGAAALALSATVSMSAAGPASAADVSKDPKVAAKLRAAEIWLKTKLAHEAAPGASIAIVHDQDVLWATGIGVANLETGAPATATTRYSVCSISKLFTSIAAMQLRDQGKLNLDAPLSTYVDWFKIKDIEGAEEPVTVRGVLSHVSGLPREADLPYWGEIDFPTAEEVRARVPDQTKLYRPYQYFQYSNLGMALMGDVIAALSGEDYHDYVRANILEPLGLSATTSEMPNALHGTELAVGYATRNGKGEREAFAPYLVNAIAPAAGYASSALDLAKFASWQIRLNEKGGEEVLKATTLREMQRIHWMAPDWDDAAWGLGFAARRVGEKTFVGHGGYCPGYRAEVMVRPQEKLGLAMLVNVNDVNPADFLVKLYKFAGDDIAAAAKAAEKKEKPKAAPKKPDLSIYEGVYRRPGYDWDAFFAPYGEHLMSVDLYADDIAASFTRYQHVEGHLFRRLRDDDTLAEEVRFEVDGEGRPTQVWQHSNALIRVE